MTQQEFKHPQINQFFSDTKDSDLAPFHNDLEQQLETWFTAKKHGRKDEWDEVISQLPELTTQHIDITSDTVGFGNADEIESELQSKLAPLLKEFMPWRKGPYEFFGEKIDTEWRSDWKWQRIKPHISDLKDRAVLDIGCGNGYHMFRMLGEGARLALGIDPTRLFLYQFEVAKRLVPQLPAYLLPLRCEHLPSFRFFDTVFSLGVLYHRRSPIDHLTELLSFLQPGGELVLETLVVDGDEQTILIPEDRYAKMANVWFLPSAKALVRMVERAGFSDVRCVDINQTSVEEQRATDWMTFHSLSDFLHPDDINLTAEGLPAPKRATLIARKKT